MVTEIGSSVVRELEDFISFLSDEKDKKIGDIWQRFKLLELENQYFISSYYLFNKGPVSWAFSMKYRVIKAFHTDFGSLNIEQILTLTQHALRAQKNIASLKEILSEAALYKEGSQEKKEWMRKQIAKLAEKNPSLYEEISEVSFYIRSKNQVVELEEVVKKMLFLYEYGYASALEGKDHFLKTQIA